MAFRVERFDESGPGTAEIAVRVIDEGGHQALMTTWIALLDHDEGYLIGVASRLKEALAVLFAIGDRINLASALEAYGGLLLDLGGPVAAAPFWGRAQRLRDEISTPMSAVERFRYEEQLPTRKAGWGAGNWTLMSDWKWPGP
jgi:hypothetical protein